MSSPPSMTNCCHVTAVPAVTWPRRISLIRLMKWRWWSRKLATMQHFWLSWTTLSLYVDLILVVGCLQPWTDTLVSGLESQYQLHVSAPQQSLAKWLFIPWQCFSIIQGFFLQHFFKATSSRSLEKFFLRSLLKSSLILSMKSLVWLHILSWHNV